MLNSKKKNVFLPIKTLFLAVDPFFDTLYREHGLLNDLIIHVHMKIKSYLLSIFLFKGGSD